jgi:hypothetical protein
MDDERATPRLTEDNLEVWFEMIFSELRHVDASIEATHGWGFLKEHVYTKDEIFSLPAELIGSATEHGVAPVAGDMQPLKTGLC